MRSLPVCVAVLASVVGLACGKDDAPAVAETSGPGTTGSEPTTGAATGSAVTDATTGSTTTTAAADSSTTDDGTIDGECSIWDQDCAEGEKCAPWSVEADLIPDEVRCCPEDANAVQPGDECVVEDYLGSCLDNCELGSMCLDFDGDGMGTCQKFCGGSAENPTCEADQECFIYFAGVPFCFDKCDPLLQDCPAGQGCYPDEEAPGGTGFLCMPTIGSSLAGDLCWLLSGCAPGLLCVTPEFVPGCNENFGCCTPLCDVEEAPDPCPDVDPALACVSWYVGGQEPPDVSYQNVGACVIPP
jgi:hypothetical protein